MKRILPILSFILFISLSAPAKDFTGPEGIDPILRCFPIPATTVINFEFQKGFDKGYSIQVYNFLGRKMSETQVSNQRTSLNLNNYNRGVYIYYLTDKSGKVVETGKFQVAK